jgi:DNA-binding response OmpR family regulator
MKKLLLIDDDIKTLNQTRRDFEMEGFSVLHCQDGERAMEYFVEVAPDAVVLDVLLSGRDGFDICRDIRKQHETPIIILSTRADTLDKVIGLELGADDYMQKPFESKELIARVKAVLRRCDACMSKMTHNKDHEKRPENINYPGLRIDKARYVVYVDEKKIDMPPKELELLFFLASHPNKVFTREHLLGNVWGYDFFGESRTVDVHVKRVREKIESLSGQYNWNIKTVWGVGYKFEIV